ncbi:phospholipase A1 PLIP1, chloroplastic [Heracleum sosnowskyi]|uniref:Phospholipase A1 PLIP1, chloroplastic n=1 Tax=Heracleum sosnowskyi TaxID=360622 RepID=A0AAD8M855_9APIA|nr:phospholipase A1 PLIP1, chloroplastic [Heracleum sosnowskyi]
MACTNMSNSTSQLVTSPKQLSKEGSEICRTFSGNDLRNQVKMQRFYSDIHLCHSVNQIHASKMDPKLKNSWSLEVFKFHLTGSFLPKSLPNFSRILQIRTRWIPKQQIKEADNDSLACEGFDIDGEKCEVDSCEDEVKENKEIDLWTFSKLLKKVSWTDTKLFSQSAFLCNMSYAISEMTAVDLRRHFGLEFVTSSLEKKEEAAVTKATLGQDFAYPPVDASPATKFEFEKSEVLDKNCLNNHPSVAYVIATSAASYVRSRAKDQSLLDSERQEDNSKINESNLLHEEKRSAQPRVYKTEVLAEYVTASTMTAVIATSEEEEEAAMALQSFHSSPGDWFVCDDSSTYTRCFVIQGSDSLASWQSNLLFEPTMFEGTDVLVHRGVYEAAKGMYEQLKPIIMEHLDKYGEGAKLSFTGHCFGGSVSLLVSLMLLTRKVVKPSALRPVVTFGSPFVFCDGQKILDALGLDEDHVHSVIMHRDIVPRAFSCNYPDHIVQILKRLNGAFRSHPCLIKNAKIYVFTHCNNALMAFLNSPHPLDTLKNITAYGSNGTLLRDHDSSNYLKAVNGVLRHHKTAVTRTARRQRSLLWPILTSQSPHAWGSCHDDN